MVLVVLVQVPACAPKKRSFMEAGAYSSSGRIVTDSVFGMIRGLCIYLFCVSEDVVCLKAWLFRPKMARVWVQFWLTIGLQRATWYNMLVAKHDSILVLQTDSYLWPRPVRVTVNITLTNLGSSTWLGGLNLVRFKKSPERYCIVCRCGCCGCCCCCCCCCSCCCIDGPMGSHVASYLVGNWDSIYIEREIEIDRYMI